MKSWPLMIATIMLASTWLLIESLSYGESVQGKKAFHEFPLTVADRWKGKELGLEDKVLEVLKLTDYMMRVYWPLGESESNDLNAGKMVGQEGFSKPREVRELGPVWLYVGYYESQRTGSTYHSPKNCLPGAGWQFVESEYITVPMGNGLGQVINRVLIEKGLEQQVILYWYQDRGRVIASEYWAKGYMIWDAIMKNRTDGSLVRISIPVTTNPEAAYQHGINFIQDLWPVSSAVYA